MNLLIVLVQPALALDATGAQPVPTEGALTDPMVARHPVRPELESGSAELLLEAAGRTLVLTVEDDGQTSELEVLKSFWGLDLVGGASLGKRVAVGVAMPFWLGVEGAAGTGAALGDLHVEAPVAILRPGEDGLGLGVSAVPWVEAPTGDADRFLGRGAFGGGATAVVGYGVRGLRMSGNLGVAASGGEPRFGVDDRLRFSGAAAVSWAPVPYWGFTFETDLTKPIVGAIAGEARVSTRVRLPGGVRLVGGVATALGDGPGGAALRLYGGVGYQFKKKAKKVEPIVAPTPAATGPYDVTVRALDDQGAGLPGATVVATRGEEIRTAAAAADGAAKLGLDAGDWSLRVSAEGYDAQRRTLVLDAARFRAAEIQTVLPRDEAGDATLALVFTDAAGQPIEDARVRIDGVDRGVTGPGGSFAIEGIGAVERVVSVDAPGFVSREGVAVTPGDAPVRVVLDRPSGTVHLRVRSATGVVSDAQARFLGPTDVAPLTIGPTGESDIVLGPGAWQVVVSSEGFGLQVRDVEIAPDDTGLLVVDVLLRGDERGQAALGVRVVDPDGRSVEDAEILLDGQSIGRTSNTGAFRLEQLDEGLRKIEVRGAMLRAGAGREVELTAGWRDVIVPVQWLPGSVEVVARGPDGPVPDAQVRFVGAEALPAADLGPDGRAFFSLTTGDWLAALASGTYGLQTRELRVEPDEASLLVVDAVMRAAEDGQARLTVRVRDPDRAPVEGASVLVDGLDVGSTASAGTLTLEGLQPGRRTIAVRADLYEEAVVPAFYLVGGDNLAAADLRWVPGRVVVRAVSPDGAPVDALARFYGPEVQPPVALGRDGTRAFALSPGRWTAVVSSATYGLASEQVDIVPGQDVEIALALTPPDPERASLLVEIVDDRGAPVSGVTLKVDGQDRPVNGGAVVLDLPPGKRTLTLDAPGFAPLAPQKLVLQAGDQERRLQLKPLPRAVRLSVTADGAPVDAEARMVGTTTVATSVSRGAAAVSLRPGVWQVLVTSPGLAASQQEIVVPPGIGTFDVVVALHGSAIEVTQTSVQLQDQVRFRFNEASIEPSSFALLDEIAATLQTDASIKSVEVQGHTDTVGGEAYNLALSQRRADAVRDYLVAKGVARDRLGAKGYGASRPQATNDTEEGRTRNRRVQFEVVR
jgi:outer membrane protein OmpA-like peptidoglycan-associated protein